MKHLLVDLLVLSFPLWLVGALYLVFWPVDADLRETSKWERE